jgi:hypothetical protein
MTATSVHSGEYKTLAVDGAEFGHRLTAFKG